MIATFAAQALVKFNESLAMNKNLRERIDTLRRERVVFDSIYKKLERELHEKKKVWQSTGGMGGGRTLVKNHHSTISFAFHEQFLLRYGAPTAHCAIPLTFPCSCHMNRLLWPSIPFDTRILRTSISHRYLQHASVS